MSNVTVVISVKPDSASRLENLEKLRGYYSEFGEKSEILVVEQGEAPTVQACQGLRVHFVRDAGFHWKTRNMNLGASISTRPFLLMSDCDTFPHPEALKTGVDRIEAGADFINLYNGIVVDLSKGFFESHIGWREFILALDHFEPADVTPGRTQGDTLMRPIYGNANHRALGGSFICSRTSFFVSGGWNTNLISYGFEDQEFHHRVCKLGYAFPFFEGYNLYHFSHPRGMESRYGDFYRQNRAEFDRIRIMSEEQLSHYVAQGFRSMSFEQGYDYTRFSSVDAEGWHRVKDSRTDLKDLTILVIADPDIVAPERSCLEELIDHLELNFRNYDLRICENLTTKFKYPMNRKQVSYSNTHYGPSQEELKALLHEADRPYVLLVRLSSDSKSQLQDLICQLSRVHSGLAVKAVFPSLSAVLENGV